jgi:phosphohistidine phosphatase
MFLRHAKSDRPMGIDDHERPLAKRGRQDSARMGGYMAASGLVPDLAIVSTARRGQETWKLARPAFVTAIAQQDERRIYDASAGSILDVIQEADSNVHKLLLVGHNPGLHDLALKLIATARKSDLARLQRKFPTAALVVINFDTDQWNGAAMTNGRLERFETPKSIGPA